MNSEESHFTQVLALVLIIIALAGVGMADKWNWRDLANAAQTVLGFGGGILTGKYLTSASSVNNQSGGQVNITPEPPKE